MRPRPAKQCEVFGIEEVETGVDWITHIAESKKDVELVHSLCMEIHQEDRENGSKVQPFNFQGYSGWHTARIRHGWRSGKVLMQASGSWADSIATRMRSSSGRTTRLDVQATVKLSRSHPDCAIASLKPSAGIPRSRLRSLGRTGLTVRNDGLCIGMVGQRTDPRYMRVYDKGVESRSAWPTLKWRWELEAKQGLARELWKDYRQAEDVRAWCYGSLEAQWKSSGYSWLLPECSRQRSALRAPAVPPPDAVRLAAWLRMSVAPTLPRVLAVYSPDELLDLLGVSHLYSPKEATSDPA